jgi:hypothetical protein
VIELCQHKRRARANKHHRRERTGPTERELSLQSTGDFERNATQLSYESAGG